MERYPPFEVNTINIYIHEPYGKHCFHQDKPLIYSTKDILWKNVAAERNPPAAVTKNPGNPGTEKLPLSHLFSSLSPKFMKTFCVILDFTELHFSKFC
jgi:hypothetical protein